MDIGCQLVVFSDKAYNAIIRETFEWDPVETGGILLGHILDNGCWIVMEVLPPGYGEGREGDNVFHEYGYFEYNRKFVNYLAKSVAEQYEIPLELLGLWHRHPGSMDHFSGTDDGTNSTFAMQNSNGVISGLINVDPQLRLTMYYLSHTAAQTYGRPNYQIVDVEVGSDLIPEEYFKLRYVHGEERDLHPYAPKREGKKRVSREKKVDNSHNIETEDKQIDGKAIVERQIARNNEEIENTEFYGRKYIIQKYPLLKDFIENLKIHKTKIIILLATISLLFGLSFTSSKDEISNGGCTSDRGDMFVTEELYSADGKDFNVETNETIVNDTSMEKLESTDKSTEITNDEKALGKN